MKPRFEKILLGTERSFELKEIQMARFDAPWHFHPELELTWIKESRGRRFVGDSHESFEPGDLVLVGANLPHFWRNPGQHHGRAAAVVVQFTPDFLGPGFLQKPELAAVSKLFAQASRGLTFEKKITAEVAKKLQTLPGDQGLTRLLGLLNILHLLAGAKRQPLASPGYRPDLNHQSQSRLSKVYAFLTAHFQEPLSLSQIAKSASMTPAAFSRFFKRQSGRNISVFLNDLRIEHACELLQQTEKPIGEIGFESGFATLSSFNREFRQRRNITPREYRP